VRQLPPCTTGAQHIQDAVEHLAPRKFCWRASTLGLGNEWTNYCPLFVADIAWIRFAFLHPKLCNTLINIVPVLFSDFFNMLYEQATREKDAISRIQDLYERGS
jgi:hypothetical protein